MLINWILQIMNRTNQNIQNKKANQKSIKNNIKNKTLKHQLIKIYLIIHNLIKAI